MLKCSVLTLSDGRVLYQWNDDGDRRFAFESRPCEAVEGDILKDAPLLPATLNQLGFTMIGHDAGRTYWAESLQAIG